MARKRPPRRPRLDTRPPADPRREHRQTGRERDRNFYADQFTAEELALMTTAATDPALDDEIWMTRVLNRRMLAQAGALEAEGGDLPLDLLVKAAQALIAGAGRVARLLRDRQVLTGELADSAASSLAEALEGVFDDMGWTR